MKNIVLVIGAGASYEFDVVIGAVLIERIIGDIDYNKGYHSANGQGRYLDMVNQFFNYKKVKERDKESYYQSTIILFKERLKSWSESERSIDAFLNETANKEFRDFGRFSIAYHIIGAEEWIIRQNIYGIKNNWLKVFLEKHLLSLISDIQEDQIQLKMIVFNYDRIIEHFTYNYLRHKVNPIPGWDGKRDQAKEIIDKLNIIHVYDKIADLEWENKSDLKRSFQFGERNNNEDYSTIASDRIQLIGQNDNGRLSIEKKEEITHVIKEAEKIYFLGFGFDEDNMKILFGDEVVKKGFRVKKDYKATSFKLRNEKKIKRMYPFIKFYKIECFNMVKNGRVFKIR